MSAASSQAGRGYLLVTLATLFHAGVPVSGKYAMKSMTPMTFGVVYMGCVGVMGIVFLIAVKGPSALAAEIRAHWKPLVAMGMIFPAGAWTFFQGLSYVNATEASFFGRFAAVFAVILGVIVLKERLKAGEYAGISLAIVGSLVISYHGGRLVFEGMILIMLSGICFAVGTMIGKMNIKGVDPVLLVAMPASIAAALLAPVGLLTRTLHFAAPAPAYAAVAAATFFGDFLGIATFYRSMKYIGFSVASAMRSMHPLLVAALSYFTVKTLPDAWGWTGGGIIVAGVVMLTLSGARREPAAAVAVPVADGD